MRIYELIIR